MADSDLYDTDILAWSEQQAAVLRALAVRHDLPNDLDLSHVAEEIEDLGLSQTASGWQGPLESPLESIGLEQAAA